MSVKFINDPKHTDLKEKVKERLAAAYDQQAAQAVAASSATAAQLRVKVANHAAQLRRQDHVIKVLERKLGEYLGTEIAAELPAITGAALASKPDRERIAELERRVVELEDELLTREDTVDGLRTALRQGIRRSSATSSGWPTSCAASAALDVHGPRRPRLNGDLSDHHEGLVSAVGLFHQRRC